MGLTRPRLDQLITGTSTISDPITVLHGGSTSANVDVGFLINRANGLVSNVALYWNESGNAFVTAFTSNIGITDSNIAVSYYAPLITGNLTATNLTATTATTGGLQAQAIGNVTPGTGAFTTATTGGLQAQAIGNVTPGTAAFTTGTFSSTLGVTGATTLSTATVGGVQAQAIGNVTPGTGAFTTGTFSSTLGVTGAATLSTATVGGVQAQAIGNVTPGTGAFTTATAGGVQAQAIGNVTPGTGAFTTGTFSSTLGVTGAATLSTATEGGVQAQAIGNVTPGTGAFTTGTFSSTLVVTGVGTYNGNIASTSTSTGAAVVVGGIGISGNVYSDKLYVTSGIFWAGNNNVISSGGGGSAPAGSTAQIQYNNGGELGAAALNYYSGNTVVVATAGLTSTSTTSGSFQVLGGVGISGNIVANQVHALSNGSGTNFKVGDDAWFGDINIANTVGLRGQQDATQGYIVFGNSNNTTYIGRSGTNPITVTGAFSVTGTITAATVNAGTIGNAGATLTGTLSTAAQTNITSLGTLTGLTVTGNTDIQNTVYGRGIYDTSTRVVSTSSGAGNLTISGTGINLTATGPGATGPIGSSVSIPIITTDAYGRITALTSTAVSTTINLVGTTGTGSVSGGGTLTFAGSYGETAIVSSSTVTISSAQDIRTSAGPTFANITVPNIIHSGTNGTGNIGEVGATFATVYATTFSGVSTTAKYADLAENYTTDQVYEPGTVIVVASAEDGGCNLAEGIASYNIGQRVLGVVSTNPAFIMNHELDGQAIALRGRVPVKVVGSIRKGQPLICNEDGKGMYGDTSNSFAIALETNEEHSVKLVECVIL